MNQITKVDTRIFAKAKITNISKLMEFTKVVLVIGNI